MGVRSNGHIAMSVKRWRSALEVIQAVAIIAVCAAILWVLLFRGAQPVPSAQAAATGRGSAAPPPPPPLPAEPLSLDGAARLGSAEAAIALIVYSDFQCPYCGRFARETLPTLVAEYIKPGKVLLAFRHFPLANHVFAQKAAESAECAGQQGKFWEMHDGLFFNQRDLNLDALAERAHALGLDARRFNSCLEGLAVGRVQSDFKAGQGLTVTGTPTFFAGLRLPDGRVKVSKRFAGAAPVNQFRTTLDGLLATLPSNAVR